jgi:hypothetical protein
MFSKFVKKECILSDANTPFKKMLCGFTGISIFSGSTLMSFYIGKNIFDSCNDKINNKIDDWIYESNVKTQQKQWQKQQQQQQQQQQQFDDKSTILFIKPYIYNINYIEGFCCSSEYPLISYVLQNRKSNILGKCNCVVDALFFGWLSWFSSIYFIRELLPVFVDMQKVFFRSVMTTTVCCDIVKMTMKYCCVTPVYVGFLAAGPIVGAISLFICIMALHNLPNA